MATVTINAGSSSEDFSSGNLIANCWAASGTVASFANFNYATQSGFGVGTGSIRYNFFSVTAGQTLIYTSPVFTALGSGQQLNFDVAGTTYTGGEIDQITLEESNDGGANWTTVVLMTNAVGDVLNTIGATQSGAFAPTAGQWASLSYGLSAGTNRVRFNGVSDFGNAVYLDNIAIGAAPTCQAPTAVGASNETGDGADIAWTCTSCTGTFIVEYGAPGFIPGTDGTAGAGGTIWTGAPVAGSPVTLTGLSALTAYSVYVREVCPGPDYSPNSAVANFTTLCGGTTCTYTARIGDIFGDGWDGSQWQVKENGNTLVVLGPQIVGCGDGGTGPVDVTFNVCEGSTLTLEWTVLGSFTDEKALQLYDANNILLYDHRGTSGSTNCGGVNWTSANSAGTLGVKYTTTTSCAPPVCLPPSAIATDVPACPGGFDVDVNITAFGETLGVPETSATIEYTVNTVPQTPVGVGSTGITTLTGFANGDVVVVTVTNDGDNTCNLILPSESYTCPPPNDDCANAISIDCNTTTSGYTTGATLETPAPAFCGTGLTAPGVWYTLAGFDGDMYATTCGSTTPYDTKINVYTGSCGSWTCVGGNDDDFTCTSNLSTVSWTGSSADTYYILVQGFSSATGAFDLFVGCGSNNNSCPDNGLAIEFQTDNAPFETTWDLLDATGQYVVASGGPLAAPWCIVARVCMRT